MPTAPRDIGISEARGLLEAPHNRILTALPLPEQARLGQSVKRIVLHAGHPLHQAGTALEHIYFPAACIVSQQADDAEGASAELLLVGYEGLIGLGALFGGKRALAASLVHTGGVCYRIPAQVFLERFNASAAVRTPVLHYIGTVMTQMSQTAYCMRRHALEQRLCRWLLQSLERRGGPEFRITQEAMSTMLGVRRETISIAAARLQEAGAITYRRGTLVVTDPERLERGACACYGRMRIAPVSSMFPGEQRPRKLRR